ncbi:MAG: hypothetical protein IH987_15555 [Planctomycetes bacterium]|nr:hypothetical protein [Planctomycetota bacterium]
MSNRISCLGFGNILTNCGPLAASGAETTKPVGDGDAPIRITSAPHAVIDDDVAADPTDVGRFHIVARVWRVLLDYLSTEPILDREATVTDIIQRVGIRS